jgi:hypothetical protein
MKMSKVCANCVHSGLPFEICVFTFSFSIKFFLSHVGNVEAFDLVDQQMMCIHP